MPKKKHLLKFTATMDEYSNISMVASKVGNNQVTEEQCEDFIKELKAELDSILKGWKEIYKGGS